MTTIDLTEDLRRLALVATGADAVNELVRRGLEWLARVAPYDLATLFELEGDRLIVKTARGPLASERVRRHSILLKDFPTVREAIELRRARAYTEEDHRHGDGDPFDGVLDLPDGHSCMVVPLAVGDRTIGILSLDRSECARYPQSVVDLVEVYAQILALALVNAEQSEMLDRLRAQERDHVTLLERDRYGESTHDFARGTFGFTQSDKMRVVLRKAEQVARTDTSVLLRGETGTGKEHLARAIHAASNRSERPFIALNCAAIPETLLEAELFGTVKGAFTGATAQRAGRFQTANGGTLLLDEIGELSMPLQAKLLRVLQNGSFEAVGSDRTVRVDVRVLAATHVNLEQAIQQGRFREDLFYRLSVFPIELLPLRERMEDLESLCETLLKTLATRTNRRVKFRLTEGALKSMRRYRWPGNIRELANVLERATIVSPGSEIHSDAIDLREAKSETPQHVLPARAQSLEQVEREHIEWVLQSTKGRVYGANGAAEILGLKPSTLQSRMKKWGIARVPQG